MNEYQDQAVWFEVQYFGTGRNNRQTWFTISDHDTREQAEARKRTEEASHPGVAYKVRRVAGLA